MVVNVFFLVLLLVIFIAILVLQVFLSKSTNKFLGLIIPGISFLLSLNVILGYMNFAEESGLQLILQLAYLLLANNIGTLILLAIYFYYRHQKQIQIELDKMKKQDL